MEMWRRDCPSCGESFSPDARFCTACGEELVDVPSGDAAGGGGSGTRRFRLILGLVTGVGVGLVLGLATGHWVFVLVELACFVATPFAMYDDLRALEERPLDLHPAFWLFGTVGLYVFFAPLYLYVRRYRQ